MVTATHRREELTPGRQPVGLLQLGKSAFRSRDGLLQQLLQPFQKILQITKRAMLFSVPDDLLDHRSSNPLDRRKSVTDITVIYRKITNPTIDIRRQDRNSHLSASVNVFGNLSRIVDDRSHKRCHIFYRIIIFQIRCLV